MSKTFETYVAQYRDYVKSAIERYFEDASNAKVPGKLDTYYKDFAEQLVRFSMDINQKANGILAEAAENAAIDNAHLQKELFHIGKEFIQDFSSRHRLTRPDENAL